MNHPALHKLHFYGGALMTEVTLSRVERNCNVRFNGSRRVVRVSS